MDFPVMDSVFGCFQIGENCTLNEKKVDKVIKKVAARAENTHCANL